MEYNCKWVEAVLAVVVLVFAFWPSQILSVATSRWIVIVAAALLLVHSLSCKKCGGLCYGTTCEPDVKEKPKQKKK